MAVLVGWLVAIAAAGPARAAEPDPNDDSASLDRAVAMIKEGADGQEIVALLEPLGHKGNARAQLLLGALHLDGKSMPRDVVQGHAWLEIAAATPDPALARQAKDMLLAYAAAMSGSELIQAEQRVAAIRSVMAERAYQRYAAGLRHFTTERPVSFFPWIKFGTDVAQLTTPAASLSDPDFQLGCAATAARRCLAKSQRVEGPRCTGRIVQADSGPSAAPSPDTHIVPGDMPTDLRRRGSRATAYLVVHVDHSGWVCGAAIAASSGAPSWDAAALTAVTRWRLNPALRDGEAVEGLYIVALAARSLQTAGSPTYLQPAAIATWLGWVNPDIAEPLSLSSNSNQRRPAVAAENLKADGLGRFRGSVFLISKREVCGLLPTPSRLSRL